MPNDEYNLTSLHHLIFFLSTSLCNSHLSVEADYFRKLLHLNPEAAGIQVNASIMQPLVVRTVVERTVDEVLVMFMVVTAAMLGPLAAVSVAVRVDVDRVGVNVVNVPLVVMAAVVIAFEAVVILITGGGRYYCCAIAGVVTGAVALYIYVAAIDAAIHDSLFVAAAGLFVVANFWVVVRFAGDAVGAAFAVGVGGFYVAAYIASRPVGGVVAGVPCDVVVPVFAAILVVFAVTLTIRLGSVAQPEGVIVAGVPTVAASAIATATDGNNAEGNIDEGNIDFDIVEFDDLPEEYELTLENGRALWHTRMVPYQLAVDKNLPSYYLRLLLRAAPDLNPAELVRLNYEERRMALILAYMPTSDGKPTLRHPPSLLTRLLEHGDDKELLKHVVSFL